MQATQHRGDELPGAPKTTTARVCCSARPRPAWTARHPQARLPRRRASRQRHPAHGAASPGEKLRPRAAAYQYLALTLLGTPSWQRSEAPPVPATVRRFSPPPLRCPENSQRSTATLAVTPSRARRGARTRPLMARAGRSGSPPGTTPRSPRLHSRRSPLRPEWTGGWCTDSLPGHRPRRSDTGPTDRWCRRHRRR